MSHNENRLKILGTIGSGFVIFLCSLYNFYGSENFRDLLFLLELFLSGVSVFVAFLVFGKYLSVGYVVIFRAQLIGKCVGALVVIFTNLYFVDMLMLWMGSKSSLDIDIKIDQQWFTLQLMALVIFIGSNFDAIIDFDTMLETRLGPYLNVANFGETALEMGKLTRENLDAVEADMNEWMREE